MTQANKFYYEFGAYRFDPEERVLLRDGKSVALTPKAQDILLLLLKNSGHLVEKANLIEEVWPGTYVEEANLAQNIFTLRRVLGKGSESVNYIETVPRRGYRFVAPVKRVSPTPISEAPPGEASDSRKDVSTCSLAVLPFINSNGDTKVDYLSDGITESIINNLSQLPQLRVMSRNTVFRYKACEVDAQAIGNKLGVDAVLVGRVHILDGRLLISTELVDVTNGWQLWGENYDQELKQLLDVQEAIARQISSALRLRLTGAEERQLTRRYTEKSEAYQAYLQGRYYWGKYTKADLEKATNCFRDAIDLDPNYALAYAGIVDCYLRLATNYIPPAEAQEPAPKADLTGEDNKTETGQPSPEAIGLRSEWDRKAAERELRRASQLNTSYPAAHQWFAAYQFARGLYEKNLEGTGQDQEGVSGSEADLGLIHGSDFSTQFQATSLTPDEEVQVFCTIAREQIDTGNYEAASAVLERWWMLGEWPKGERLEQASLADLLFTTGALAGWLASARRVRKGQKLSEELISGAIALFEQLGSRTRAAEGRIELAYCYYREGLFELARNTLITALKVLPAEERALRVVGLIRLAIVERQAGRLNDSAERLTEANKMVDLVGPFVTGRYHHELATTLKEVAIAGGQEEYFDRALHHYEQALSEFEAIGNHRYCGVQENNRGYLLLTLGRLSEAEVHLVRARRIFHAFKDIARCAQVDETLAQLYAAQGRLDLAQQTASHAVSTLEMTGEDSLLAFALGTQGLSLCKLKRFREAKRVLERAYQLAECCGDDEGAARALIITIEEICEHLDRSERKELESQVVKALQNCQHLNSRKRLRECLQQI